VFDEHGFGDHRTRAARPGESNDRRQQMQNKDDQVAHPTILARSHKATKYTEFARDGKEVTGRRNIAPTQKYTHLRPTHEMPAHECLADAMPSSDLVMVPRKRAAGKPVGKSVGTLSDTDGKLREKRGHPAKLAKLERMAK
jgi:hypothetical protein